MAKTPAGPNEFFDVTTAFGDFRMPGFDAASLIQAHRKNVEAITQANQIAVEGVRAVTRRQTEIVRQAVEEGSALLRDWMEPSAPEDRIAKAAGAAKLAFENTIATVRELNDLSSKATVDVFGVIARRVSESFDDVRLYAKKQGQTP